MTLVIHGLRGGHPHIHAHTYTRTRTHVHTYMHICMQVISGNQAHADRSAPGLKTIQKYQPYKYMYKATNIWYTWHTRHSW